MENKNLVFCKNCIYVDRTYREWNSTTCNNKKYIKEIITPIEIKIIPGLCEKINKDNDCPEFKERDKM